MKYRIEEFDGAFDICCDAADGVTDVIATYTTREAAQVALREANRDTSGDERHYQAQYAYACGYHN